MILSFCRILLDTYYYVLYSIMRQAVFAVNRFNSFTIKSKGVICMESQFRRGILDACVLAVLEKGESYGYQMVKDINEFLTITESTLYPILKRLESAQMLTVFTQEHNGRLRKYYKITEAGRDHIIPEGNLKKQNQDAFYCLSVEQQPCSHDHGG